MNQRAWKLPAAVLALVVASHVAAELNIHLRLQYSDGIGLPGMGRTYVRTWFGPRTGGWPVWLLCHLFLSVACIRYFRSGSTLWGWLLAAAGCLCSTTGAYFLHILLFLSAGW